MEGLSPSKRELVKKTYFEERTFASIAREEGVGESAIRDRMKDRGAGTAGDAVR